MQGQFVAVGLAGLTPVEAEGSVEVGSAAEIDGEAVVATQRVDDDATSEAGGGQRHGDRVGTVARSAGNTGAQFVVGVVDDDVSAVGRDGQRVVGIGSIGVLDH